MGSKCCKPEDKIYSDVVRINEQKQMNNNSTSIPLREADRVMEILPEFTKSLQDYSFKVNGRGKISTTIQSTADLKVTWFRNGKKLDPSNDARFHYSVENNLHSLSILQVHLDDEGKWTCVAENVVGKQASHGLVKLMIPRAYKPPEFVEPLRAILTEAGTVSLECKVTGVPTPLLQWFKDGEQIKPGDVFALKQADPTSLGSYTCQATNCMGTAVSCSHVHVTSSRPVITDGLVDHKARIGEPHVLTVGVRNPVGKVVWYNKGVEVKEDGSRVTINRNDFNVELILNPLMLSDDGEWKCSVNGVETCCFISVVAPKNYRKPRFLQDLKAVLTEEGLVTFECKVVGYPTPELKWFKDGVELKPGDVYQLCGSNSLGLYTCIASNCMGVSESTAELTFDDIQFQLTEEERGKLLEHLSSINRPPQFVKGLKSYSTIVGSRLELTVELNCKATLEWYFENQIIQPGGEFNMDGNSLSTDSLGVGKEGEYKCVAKNEYGTSFSCCRISLSIPSNYKKPRFLEGLRAVLHEGIVNLECKVIGVPQPTLKWFKDGIELKAGDIHKIVSSGGNCCLGTYTCQARNCMGTCESSASLLGFEENKKQEDVLDKLARDPSLSTILEERTSQMISVYETAEGLDEISVSIDGKEVSVSLYETPDLTEQDAKNIIEMFAEEYSEFISEHNVLTLPSLRFVKETTNSGRIVMEAVVIDVEGFETAPSRQEHDSGSEKTEADFEDISDLSESRQSVFLEDFEAVAVGAAVELVLEKERTMTSLESPTSINMDIVVSDGLRMLETPENDSDKDFKIVEVDNNSSSPEVSFYSEGLDTPVFGSLEELPQKIQSNDDEIEEDWEVVENQGLGKGFNEKIDQFGGKINEFLNELNKLTGSDQDPINIFDSSELEPVPIFNSSELEPIPIFIEEKNANAQAIEHSEASSDTQEKIMKSKGERKDSMTQTISKKKKEVNVENSKSNENNAKANTQASNEKAIIQDRINNLQDTEGFEMIEHSDINIIQSHTETVNEQLNISADSAHRLTQGIIQTEQASAGSTHSVELVQQGIDMNERKPEIADNEIVGKSSSREIQTIRDDREDKNNEAQKTKTPKAPELKDGKLPTTASTKNGDNSEIQPNQLQDNNKCASLSKEDATASKNTQETEKVDPLIQGQASLPQETKLDTKAASEQNISSNMENLDSQNIEISNSQVTSKVVATEDNNTAVKSPQLLAEDSILKSVAVSQPTSKATSLELQEMEAGEKNSGEVNKSIISTTMVKTAQITGTSAELKAESNISEDTQNEILKPSATDINRCPAQIPTKTEGPTVATEPRDLVDKKQIAQVTTVEQSDAVDLLSSDLVMQHGNELSVEGNLNKVTVTDPLKTQAHNTSNLQSNTISTTNADEAKSLQNNGQQALRTSELAEQLLVQNMVTIDATKSQTATTENGKNKQITATASVEQSSPLNTSESTQLDGPPNIAPDKKGSTTLSSCEVTSQTAAVSSNTAILKSAELTKGELQTQAIRSESINIPEISNVSIPEESLEQESADIENKTIKGAKATKTIQAHTAKATDEVETQVGLISIPASENGNIAIAAVSTEIEGKRNGVLNKPNDTSKEVYKVTQPETLSIPEEQSLLNISSVEQQKQNASISNLANFPGINNNENKDLLPSKVGEDGKNSKTLVEAEKQQDDNTTSQEMLRSTGISGENVCQKSSIALEVSTLNNKSDKALAQGEIDNKADNFIVKDKTDDSTNAEDATKIALLSESTTTDKLEDQLNANIKKCKKIMLESKDLTYPNKEAKTTIESEIKVTTLTAMPEHSESKEALEKPSKGEIKLKSQDMLTPQESEEKTNEGHNQILQDASVKDASIEGKDKAKTRDNSVLKAGTKEISIKESGKKNQSDSDKHTKETSTQSKTDSIKEIKSGLLEKENISKEENTQKHSNTTETTVSQDKDSIAKHIEKDENTSHKDYKSGILGLQETPKNSDNSKQVSNQINESESKQKEKAQAYNGNTNEASTRIIESCTQEVLKATMLPSLQDESQKTTPGQYKNGINTNGKQDLQLVSNQPLKSGSQETKSQNEVDKTSTTCSGQLSKSGSQETESTQEVDRKSSTGSNQSNKSGSQGNANAKDADEKSSAAPNQSIKSGLQESDSLKQDDKTFSTGSIQITKSGSQDNGSAKKVDKKSSIETRQLSKSGSQETEGPNEVNRKSSTESNNSTKLESHELSSDKEVKKSSIRSQQLSKSDSQNTESSINVVRKSSTDSLKEIDRNSSTDGQEEIDRKSSTGSNQSAKSEVQENISKKVDKVLSTGSRRLSKSESTERDSTKEVDRNSSTASKKSTNSEAQKLSSEKEDDKKSSIGASQLTKSGSKEQDSDTQNNKMPSTTTNQLIKTGSQETDGPKEVDKKSSSAESSQSTKLGLQESGSAKNCDKTSSTGSKQLSKSGSQETDSPKEGDKKSSTESSKSNKSGLQKSGSTKENGKATSTAANKLLKSGSQENGTAKDEDKTSSTVTDQLNNPELQETESPKDANRKSSTESNSGIKSELQNNGSTNEIPETSSASAKQLTKSGSQESESQKQINRKLSTASNQSTKSQENGGANEDKKSSTGSTESNKSGSQETDGAKGKDKKSDMTSIQNTKSGLQESGSLKEDDKTSSTGSIQNTKSDSQDIGSGNQINKKSSILSKQLSNSGSQETEDPKQVDRKSGTRSNRSTKSESQEIGGAKEVDMHSSIGSEKLSQEPESPKEGNKKPSTGSTPSNKSGSQENDGAKEADKMSGSSSNQPIKSESQESDSLKQDDRKSSIGSIQSTKSGSQDNGSAKEVDKKSGIGTKQLPKSGSQETKIPQDDNAKSSNQSNQSTKSEPKENGSAKEVDKKSSPGSRQLSKSDSQETDSPKEIDRKSSTGSNQSNKSGSQESGSSKEANKKSDIAFNQPIKSGSQESDSQKDVDRKSSTGSNKSTKSDSKETGGTKEVEKKSASKDSELIKSGSPEEKTVLTVEDTKKTSVKMSKQEQEENKATDSAKNVKLDSVLLVKSKSQEKAETLDASEDSETQIKKAETQPNNVGTETQKLASQTLVVKDESQDTILDATGKPKINEQLNDRDLKLKSKLEDGTNNSDVVDKLKFKKDLSQERGNDASNGSETPKAKIGQNIEKVVPKEIDTISLDSNKSVCLNTVNTAGNNTKDSAAMDKKKEPTENVNDQRKPETPGVFTTKDVITDTAKNNLCEMPTPNASLSKQKPTNTVGEGLDKNESLSLTPEISPNANGSLADSQAKASKQEPEEGDLKFKLFDSTKKRDKLKKSIVLKSADDLNKASEQGGSMDSLTGTPTKTTPYEFPQDKETLAENTTNDLQLKQQSGHAEKSPRDETTKVKSISEVQTSNKNDKTGVSKSLAEETNSSNTGTTSTNSSIDEHKLAKTDPQKKVIDVSLTKLIPGKLESFDDSKNGSTGKSEEKIKDSTGKSEEKIKGSSGKAEEKIKESTGKSEENIKGSTAKSEENIKDSTSKSEEKMKDSTGKSEEKMKDSTGKSEEKTKDSTGKSEEKIKDGTGKSEEKIKDDTGKSEEKIKDGTGKSEEKIKDGTGKSEEKIKDIKFIKPTATKVSKIELQSILLVDGKNNKSKEPDNELVNDKPENIKHAEATTDSNGEKQIAEATKTGVEIKAEDKTGRKTEKKLNEEPTNTDQGKKTLDKKAKEASESKTMTAAEKKVNEQGEKAKSEANAKADETKTVSEADKKVNAEAEKKAKEESKNKEEVENKAKVEAEKKAKEEAEKKAKEEAEKKAKEEAEKKSKVEAEKKAKVEAEKKAKEEAEKKAKVEAEKKAKVEAEKKAKVEAEKKEKAEAEKKAKAEAEKKLKEEAEKKEKAEAEKKAKAKAEAEKKAKAEAEKKLKEEAEKKEKAEAGKKLKEKTEKKTTTEAQKKTKEETEKKEKDESEKSKLESSNKSKKDAGIKTKTETEAKPNQESDKKTSDEEADHNMTKKKIDGSATNGNVDTVKKSTELGEKSTVEISQTRKGDTQINSSASSSSPTAGGKHVEGEKSGDVNYVEKSEQESLKNSNESSDTVKKARLSQKRKNAASENENNGSSSDKDESDESKESTKVDNANKSLNISGLNETARNSDEYNRAEGNAKQRSRESNKYVDTDGDSDQRPRARGRESNSDSQEQSYPRVRESYKLSRESETDVTVRKRHVWSEHDSAKESESSTSVRNYSRESKSVGSYKDGGSLPSPVRESRYGDSMGRSAIPSSSRRSEDITKRRTDDSLSLHSKLDLHSSRRSPGALAGSTDHGHWNSDFRSSYDSSEHLYRTNIPKRETKSMLSLDETSYDSNYQSLKHNFHESGGHQEFGHALKARDYMKSLGYYSAIEEHDCSLAGVDDLPVDSSHGYNAMSRRRPKFTIKLTDRVISTGSTLSLNCSATGTPLPNLEWFRNGFPVLPDSRVKIIGGVGFGSLEIRGVEKPDQAEFSCVASNSFGRARTSSTIHVFDLNYTRVVMPVLFYSQMITETRRNNEIVLETLVKGHDELTWEKDDKPICGPNYFSQNFSDGRCRLTIKNPRAGDSGTWTLTGRNRYSCNSLSKYVKIEEFSTTGFKLPIFLKGLSDLAVEIGDSILLSVTVEGAEAVEFYKNGRLRETRLNRIGSYSTLIPFVQTEDLGVYVAVAKNRFGQVESCCSLRMIGGHASAVPVFVVKPKPVYIVDVGVDLNIVVQVDGEPTPFVNWYKGCRNVTLENPRAFRETLSPGSVRFTLKRLACSDAGLYTLKAKNLTGEDVTQFYVQVRETRARSLTPVSTATERRSSLPNRNRHCASVERLARSYRHSTLQSQAYSSSFSRERLTPGMAHENGVTIKEILPGWVSIQWNRVRGRIIGYNVHCKEVSDENSKWIQLAFTRLCSHEANLLPGRDYIFRITPKCKSTDDDEFYMLSESFFLSNRVVPEFTQLLPVTTTGLIGKLYTLRCQLREGVPCSITWSRDGEPLNLGKSFYKSSFSNHIAQLEFIVNEEDGGRFCCEAKNTFGRTISYSHFETTANSEDVIPCNLESIEYPVILMEPKNRIVKNGSNAIVSCQVSTDKCNVQWIFNGKTISDEDRNYKITNNGKFYSLEINSVSPQLVGKYILSVSNSAGKSTSQFNIHVVEDDLDVKPKFLNQLTTDLRITRGEKFTLHGFVLGSGILFYVWKKDSRLIHRNKYKCYITEHERDHASLTVKDSAAVHSGNYQCTVYNSHGEDNIYFNVSIVESYSVSGLTSNKNPAKKLSFRRRPEESELEEGDSTVVEFECEGDTCGDVLFKWYKDGLNVKDLKDAPHFTAENIGSLYRLSIRDAKMQFSGAYKLVVKSGSSSINGIVSVQVKCKSSPTPVSNFNCPFATKPVITKEIERIECDYKDNVELRVEFEPNSQLFYVHWDVNGIVSTGNNFSAIVIPSVESNMVVSVRIFNSVGFALSQGNIYIPDVKMRVGRKNNIPYGISQNSRLAARQQPRFYTHLHDRTVSSSDQSATLQVSIKCNNLTRTKWFKDNIELFNCNKYIVREEGDLKSLEILSLGSFDCGIYSVSIENRSGNNTSSCYLHVT